jgi:hypothetical protein
LLLRDHWSQEFAGIAALYLDELFRRACSNDLPARVAAFGAAKSSILASVDVSSKQRFCFSIPDFAQCFALLALADEVIE